jgi:hypothetical protein
MRATEQRVILRDLAKRPLNVQAFKLGLDLCDLGALIAVS